MESLLKQQKTALIEMLTLVDYHGRVEYHYKLNGVPTWGEDGNRMHRTYWGYLAHNTDVHGVGGCWIPGQPWVQGDATPIVMYECLVSSDLVVPMRKSLGMRERGEWGLVEARIDVTYWSVPAVASFDYSSGTITRMPTDVWFP